MKTVYSDPLRTEIDTIFPTPTKKSKALKTWITANEKEVDPPPVTDLVELDGGLDYYGRFTFPLPVDPAYFPIGVWYESVLSQSDINLDKDCGINLYVYLTADSNLDLINAAGSKALLQVDGFLGKTAIYNHPAFAGWVLMDEPDMQQANQAGAVIARQKIMDKLATVPPDGRARYINFGKGVSVWNVFDDQQKYWNDFTELQSIDNYWFTDDDLMTQWQGGEFFGFHRVLTPTESRRASNYGAVVDHLRKLDTVDAKLKPAWNFVEVGQPGSNPAWPAIKPLEIRAAVWHSIIAGCRGILYFNHSFSGPNVSAHCLREPAYAEQRAVVKSVNAQIKALAPVLNSPTAPNFATASADVRVMTKCKAGKFTMFAGARENVSSKATFTVASGTTATVNGENRSIPIRGGTFTDDFADGLAIHIYEIS
jgi:hypothetical protein